MATSDQFHGVAIIEELPNWQLMKLLFSANFDGMSASLSSPTIDIISKNSLTVFD
jgi:hypothetical protein